MMRLSFKRILSAAQWWRDQGGLMRVEVAALEPLLWSDEKYGIGDVITTLKELGFHVSMTTNGSLLEKHARALADARLDHIRVSCHTLKQEIFKNISAGGKLSSVLSGVEIALAYNIPVSMNRTLMRGYTDDLEDHIRYVDKLRIRLKLLDLYWTQDSAAEYDRFYISPEEALESVSPALIFPMASSNGIYSRERTRFTTPQGATIEFKRKSTARREDVLCGSSPLCRRCIEGYAEYFRIFPDGVYSLCYLRPDLAYPCFTGDNFSISEEEAVALRPHISGIPLRLVLEGRCNFNCGFPGSRASWCLKQGRGFSFPTRR